MYGPGGDAWRRRREREIGPVQFDWGVLDFSVYVLIDHCGTVEFFFLQ